ncbi:ACL177Wp [Eremothecium gossypii ATCC 10895]|uniref:ACL177Wp n=1 Tax=Eremothecium gossypii (strain ATCC 10895 / CBS 109.51 / FGSC 9923 / NRRL Y-1056) TaxID=284811 RepID=Q75CU6_EREGS|nr:ACL177Wp [Eremothecium gossypii ATCC 10895]AAS51051.1 ACL177Wp [Eremothecium gossypii ATCC 10895]AEY95341.1 FACL177Wp [Eremothecium gossypii FDAG1]
MQYQGEEIDAQLDVPESCFNYIRNELLNHVLDADKRALFNNEETCIQISKATHVEVGVQRAMQSIAENRAVLLYSYGQHVQRQLGAVEILKATLQERKIGYEQFNHLSCLAHVGPGRNELLETRVNIPVLLVIVAPAGSLTSLAGFQRQ